MQEGVKETAFCPGPVVLQTVNVREKKAQMENKKYIGDSCLVTPEAAILKCTK